MIHSFHFNIHNICIIFAGTLRPLFVLQPDLPSVSPATFPRSYKTEKTNYTRVGYHQSSGRGRSFSPPKKKTEDTFDQGDGVTGRTSQRFYGNLPKESFVKSFSSDNISTEARVPIHPSSLSSGCSSTSTGNLVLVK